MSKLRVRYPDGREEEVPFGRGRNGKSAYEYAKDGGYTGTEAEFAAKLAAEYLKAIPSEYVTDTELTAKGYAVKSNAETWTFTLEDGRVVTKKVVLG